MFQRAANKPDKPGSESAATLTRASDAAIEAAARSAVGRLNMIDAIQAFRNSMVELALLQNRGSRRAAARVLGVTRPAVQRVLRMIPR